MYTVSVLYKVLSTVTIKYTQKARIAKLGYTCYIHFVNLACLSDGLTRIFIEVIIFVKLTLVVFLEIKDVTLRL